MMLLVAPTFLLTVLPTGFAVASDTQSIRSVQQSSPTNILVAWHTQTNRTGLLASIISAAAASEHNTLVRSKPVTEVTCEDMLWYHGIALGSPIYWGMYSGALKTFLDEVQQRCFGWPVKQLRWKVGAGFVTGAHEASGKEQTLSALHTFYASVQMVSVSNEPPAACLLGACATNRDEHAAHPSFTDAEKADARSLAKRLVTLATHMRGLMET